MCSCAQCICKHYYCIKSTASCTVMTAYVVWMHRLLPRPAVIYYREKLAVDLENEKIPFQHVVNSTKCYGCSVGINTNISPRLIQLRFRPFRQPWVVISDEWRKIYAFIVNFLQFVWNDSTVILTFWHQFFPSISTDIMSLEEDFKKGIAFVQNSTFSSR